MVAQSTAAITLQFYTRNYLKPLISTHMVQTVLQLQLRTARPNTATLSLPSSCRHGSYALAEFGWALVLRHVLLTSGWLIWHASLLFRVQSKYMTCLKEFNREMQSLTLSSPYF